MKKTWRGRGQPEGQSVLCASASRSLGNRRSHGEPAGDSGVRGRGALVRRVRLNVAREEGYLLLGGGEEAIP
eukprot:CAMPEP_0182839070 /NCGR_PEP_ID=MMETSP0006_2-20121128/23665_1 /TAXON_ID=97485 /ORGANISM="Prymnesium parvum, Strain Texoma1" /LENGTH=71 /DNA_ID=CAMNT_0024968185 /DNA_START=689 /DNA_END=900 /DNA_ORIENTATION=+